MVFPRTRADPAEVESAHLACHMIASLVLLDGPGTLAIGTDLGVGHDPIQILAFT